MQDLLLPQVTFDDDLLLHVVSDIATSYELARVPAPAWLIGPCMLCIWHLQAWTAVLKITGAAHTAFAELSVDALTCKKALHVT
jgi:hypothetical protein